MSENTDTPIMKAAEEWDDRRDLLAQIGLLERQLAEARVNCFTVEQIEEYLTGWLFTPVNPESRAAIANGLSQLRCGEDGIKAGRDHAWTRIKSITEQRDRLAEVIKAATVLIAAKGRHNTFLAYQGLTEALATLNQQEGREG